jgi:hypothetical protein
LPYIPPDEVAELLHAALGVPVSKRSVLRMAGQGRLPRPVRLNRRRLLFDSDAVRAALAKLLAGEGSTHGAPQAE